MQRKVKCVRLPVLSALLAFPVLAGCGSSKSTSLPATTTPVAPPPPPAQSTRPHPWRSAVGPVAPPTPFPASAYSARISGVVDDARSHSPVSGAIVTVGSGLRRSQTDAFGHYSIAFPAGAPVALFVTAPGFVQGLAMGAARARQRLTVNFGLDRAVPGKPVFPKPKSFGHP